MSSTQTESPAGNPPLPATVEQPHLIYWPALLPDEQAFVAAYIDNHYSLALTAEALRSNKGALGALLRKTEVKGAIKEVQGALDNVDFLNEAWVKSQLMRLYPMVIGDEPVPMVTQMGDEVSVRKFFPEVAMKIVEYVAPKASKAPAVNISITNMGRLSDEELERIAMRGAGRVVSEQ